MCFIRNSCAHSPALLDPLGLPADIPSPSKQTISPYSSLETLPSFGSCGYYSAPDCSLLAKLMAAVTYNTQLLAKLNQNIDRESQMLQTAQETAVSSMALGNAVEAAGEGSGWRSREAVIQKLFGEKEYKYRLKLRNKFPATIYKERNIALGLELVDGDGKPVMNSNLINICVAACEVQGVWIPENEEGEYFLKGKTEVELYHGEALFQKIYPRDVSRQYENGKVDIVVYPKPSLVQFSTSASCLEQRVSANEIEPLLIRDVLIRAKKKAQ